MKKIIILIIIFIIISIIGILSISFGNIEEDKEILEDKSISNEILPNEQKGEKIGKNLTVELSESIGLATP